MALLALLLWSLVFAPITAFWAGDRGYDAMHFYLLGLLMGPIGLMVGLLPKRTLAPELLFEADLQAGSIG
jgi:hypothetical protein